MHKPQVVSVSMVQLFCVIMHARYSSVNLLGNIEKLSINCQTLWIT